MQISKSIERLGKMTKPDDIRLNYGKMMLDINSMDPNPVVQFSQWWDEALASSLPEVNAMTLATVDAEGRPSARIVLLKGFQEEGFEFFTNYESRKAQDMEANPHVALLFFWKELERQVRIEGTVEKVSEERSRAYFQSRPKGSQIGAWASPQSSTIEDRSVLDETVAELSEKYADASVLPLPDFWGGYLVRPQRIEFWQGRSNRLHDRMRYTKNNSIWQIERLAP